MRLWANYECRKRAGSGRFEDRCVVEGSTPLAKDIVDDTVMHRLASSFRGATLRAANIQDQKCRPPGDISQVFSSDSRSGQGRLMVSSVSSSIDMGRSVDGARMSGDRISEN